MKNFKDQFPPQSGLYSVKVKNGSGWNKYSTARLQISVGQEYHENEKFKATIAWLSHRFDHVIVCVNDTLQRYNYIYQAGSSEEDALNVSEEMGREWIERNIETIRTLPSFEIHRWKNWLSHENFLSQHRRIKNLYEISPEFKELIHADILEFWKRKKDKEQATYADFERFKKYSSDYLLEETAAFFLMFEKDVAADIYPGSVLLPCVLAEKYLNLPDRYLGGAGFTRIDFLRNSHSSTCLPSTLLTQVS